MKRNIFYLILLLVFFTACKDEDNDITKYNVGANFVVATASYTTLDNNVTLKCTAAFNVSTIDATLSGASAPLGQMTITDGKGSVNVSTATIPLTTASTTTKNIIYTALAEDGTTISRTSTVAMVTPFTVTAHAISQVGIDSVFYKIKPKLASVTTVAIETMVNHNGTYATYPGTYNASDTILIDGSLYHAKDTIYLKITAVSNAGKTDSNVTKLPVGSLYPNTVTVKLDTTENSAYDLLEREFVDVTTAGDASDIVFTQTPFLGGFTIGFGAPENAEFVKSNSDVYILGDKLAIEATDFSAALTSVDDVAEGDVYIYRTYRGTDSYSYGIFKVVTVAKPQGVMADSYIELQLKY